MPGLDSQRHLKPLQIAGRGTGNRVRTGLDRVESRDWVTATRVLQGFPRALVAPVNGTRTTDVAVLLSAATAYGSNSSVSDVFRQCRMQHTTGRTGVVRRLVLIIDRIPTFIETQLASHQEISAFLAEVERRAFKQALFAVRDEDSALDVVQDAMLKLTEKYAGKPVAELPMLFQRILQNTIHDHFRRQKVRSAWTTLFSSFGQKDDKDDDFDLLETLPAKSDSNRAADPARQVEQGQIVGLIEQALARLPARQREAFLLRYWEELDVAETAAAMGCSEGSVKTHCSRAVHALAEMLKARGISL
jgi:RNA polymerase sigma-70 factor, ECF subfamily